MRKLLNTLYVTLPEAYLAKDGENVVVRVDDEERFRIPIHNLEGIVSFGYPGASPALLGHCAQKGVAVTFLTEHGSFLAKVVGPVSGNVLLRRRQYRLADEEKESSRLATAFVAGKISNCRTVLQRALRDHKELEKEPLLTTINRLGGLILDLEHCETLEEVRGIEGEAAKIYFSVFNYLVLTEKEHFHLRGRTRRPPRDNMNALLSFLYTLLRHDVVAALETVGLDPAVGFLHRDRPGRPSLALDLMEELRPYMADRLALTLVNRKQVEPSGFRQKETGGIYMHSETRKTVIAAWQKRKQEQIIHPYLDEKIPIGLLPYVQAVLLARYLRGDIDGYPPFFWR
jgi:CRISPR-associated protein Cas1